MRYGLLLSALLVTSQALGASPVVAIAAGYFHNVALRADGSVVAWGVESDQKPIQCINGLTGVKAIAAGGYQSLALKNDGSPFSCGDIDLSSAPTNLKNLTAIAASGYVDMAIRSDSTLAVWGDNSFQQISNAPSALKAVFITGAFHTSAAIKKDSTVVVWGADGGSKAPPSGLRGVVSMSVSWNYNLALKRDGSVEGWPATAVPTLPSGLVAKAVAAANEFAIALKPDGTVVGWGTGEGKNVPAGLNNVIAIDAGWNHALALKANGEVVVWGSPDARFQPPNTITPITNPLHPSDLSLRTIVSAPSEAARVYDLRGRSLLAFPAAAGAASRGIRIETRNSQHVQIRIE